MFWLCKGYTSQTSKGDRHALATAWLDPIVHSSTINYSAKLRAIGNLSSLTVPRAVYEAMHRIACLNGKQIASLLVPDHLAPTLPRRALPQHQLPLFKLICATSHNFPADTPGISRGRSCTATRLRPVRRCCCWRWSGLAHFGLAHLTGTSCCAAALATR